MSDPVDRFFEESQGLGAEPPWRMSDNDLEFSIWLNNGIERGWVSPPECATHGELPMTGEENEQFEDGYDPCIPAVRIWVGSE